MLPAAHSLASLLSTTANNGELPPLQPPHGTLSPTFWEQHGWAVAAAALGTLTLLALLIVLLRRPRRVVVIPPDVLARRDLEALRGRPEDGVLLMKVSGILRRYVTFACGLPPGELTTAELGQVLAVGSQFSSDLTNATAEFFRQCDARKFSPNPPTANSGAVDGALALLEKIEKRRREISAAAPPTSLPPPIPRTAAVPPA
jgi:hypothetical protein